MLTNGGGIPEDERADYINNLLGIGDIISENEMIMCHTPFSDPDFMKQYKSEFVLVSGLGRMIDVAETTYGYEKAIDIEELFALFPQTCPSLMGHFGSEWIANKKEEVLQRFRSKGY
jgi:hypothetical protein